LNLLYEHISIIVAADVHSKHFLGRVHRAHSCVFERLQQGRSNRALETIGEPAGKTVDIMRRTHANLIETMSNEHIVLNGREA
jgi:hypothetical protein